MKKIIMLLFLVVLLTGCSANVNLTVTSNNIEEEIIINAYSDSDTTKEQVASSFRTFMPVFANVPLSDTEPDVKKTGIEYYTRRVNDLGSGYRFSYKYKYKFDDYKKSKSVNFGFDSKTIQRNSGDKNIMISTDSGGLNFFDQYPDLETVTVNIETAYKVLENNANYVNGNTYTWVLRKDTRKSIYMLIEDPNADVSYEEDEPEVPEEPEKPSVSTPEEEEENEVVSFANKYPIVIGIIAILGFLVLVLVLSKISQIKYK
jgi:hypothetical protein